MYICFFIIFCGSFLQIKSSINFSLVDIQQGTFGNHPSLCNNILCGGGFSTTLQRSCRLFDCKSSLLSLQVSLLNSRSNHLCWSLRSGDILLLGGTYSPKTTEKVFRDGSSSFPKFNLPYKTE